LYVTLFGTHQTIKRRYFLKDYQVSSELPGPFKCVLADQTWSPYEDVAPALPKGLHRANHVRPVSILVPIPPITFRAIQYFPRTKFHLPPKVFFSRQNFVFASSFLFWTPPSLSLYGPCPFCYVRVRQTSCNVMTNNTLPFGIPPGSGRMHAIMTPYERWPRERLRNLSTRAPTEAIPDPLESPQGADERRRLAPSTSRAAEERTHYL
jgi:hypothetical protein